VNGTTTISDSDIDVYFVSSSTNPSGTITLPHCNNSGTKFDGKKIVIITRLTTGGGFSFAAQGTDQIFDSNSAFTSLSTPGQVSSEAFICTTIIPGHTGLWMATDNVY
jgi:hypothetical protein